MKNVFLLLFFTIMLSPLFAQEKQIQIKELEKDSLYLISELIQTPTDTQRVSMRKTKKELTEYLFGQAAYRENLIEQIQAQRIQAQREFNEYRSLHDQYAGESYLAAQHKGLLDVLQGAWTLLEKSPNGAIEKATTVVVTRDGDKITLASTNKTATIEATGKQSFSLKGFYPTDLPFSFRTDAQNFEAEMIAANGAKKTVSLTRQ